MSARAVILYTIGHSTRALEEFLELLRQHGIRQLVDVRRYPGSRRFPHFGSEALARSLAESGIEYLHERELGGRRKAREDSVNLARRSDSFRAYADHMDDPEWRAALARLVAAGAALRTAVMCAEAVPWRCHRQLISDALVARGHEVRHIIGAGVAQPHTLSAHARIHEDGRITYP